MQRKLKSKSVRIGGEFIEKVLEMEQKFSFNEKWTVAEIEKIIEKFGLRRDGFEELRDVYWDNEDCKIMNLKRGLRVRFLFGVLKSVEFKSLFVNAMGKRLIEEISLLDEQQNIDLVKLNNLIVNRLQLSQTKVKNENNINNILSNYGLSPCMIISKKRSVFTDTKKNITVTVDLVENLPPHLEVELVGDDYDAYQEFIVQLKKTLPDDLREVKLGYNDLLAQKNPKILPLEVFLHRFEHDPEWNVLESEKKLVQELFTLSH
ncbi:MAG: CYTH domain-containing protein [Mycoplasmataceae bacterium]|jgi:adenylate cyclase class IV|nr:CYTH domain-containing protein [Mycoplasmataceae bacterium]